VTLLDAVKAVGRDADRRASEIEGLRTLPNDLVAALVDTGLFRKWVPRVYGGDEAGLPEVLDAIEELSFYDGATGWCAMIAATSSLASAYLQPEWARQIYGDPRAITAGYAMPAGRACQTAGGLVVNGDWQWGSFSQHCTWLGGGCLVVGDDGKPSPRADGLATPFVFFEPEQVELLDTWRVAGLKGTGSTDYRARDAFIPEGRWVQFLGTAPVVDAPLYRFPFIGALALGVSAVTIGLARRAHAELIAIAGGKRPSGSGRTLAERSAVQAEVARAEAAFRSARAFVREVIHNAWGSDDVEHRRLVRLAATDATTRAAYAVDLMYTAAGGSSIHESSPLQRVFRDVHVATQHGTVAARIYEPVGRMALGLPTDPTQL
jgi:alkylation response protein AidB-like acyl-CoA dehydrogenase